MTKAIEGTCRPLRLTGRSGTRTYRTGYLVAGAGRQGPTGPMTWHRTYAGAWRALEARTWTHFGPPGLTIYQIKEETPHA